MDELSETRDASNHLRLAYLADPNSIHTRRWIEYFAGHGHEVHLLMGHGVELAPGLDGRVQVHPYAAHRRSRVPGRSLAMVRRGVRDLLRQIDPDVLHALFVRRYGWHSALSGFHPRVVSPWGSDLLRVGWSQVRVHAWNFTALRSADLVTASSELMLKAAMRSGARSGRVRLISHGVDTAQFSPGSSPRGLRERLAIGGGPVILSPRTLRPLYRQEVVIEALGLLSEQGQRPTLIMSARGADDAYLTSLKSRAERLGVDAQLRILDDVAHGDLPDLLRLASVVLSVPESDSFPVTLLEAMACGRPIVVSDLPAVTPELSRLDPLAAELVVPVGDARATAAAIARALALTGSAQERLAQVYRSYVVAHADYAASMAKMERLYSELKRAGAAG